MTDPDTLDAAVRDACARWAGRTALVFRGRPTTYAELDEAAEAVASTYRALGIAPGDRVVCRLPNRPEHLAAAYAAWRCAAVHVGAHPDLTGPELSELVELTGAAALLCEPGPDGAGLTAARAVREAHPHVRVVVVGETGEAGEFPALAGGGGEAGGTADGPSPADPACIFMTSGSTGRPKLPLGFHGRLRASWSGLAGQLGFGPDDVHLAHLPLAHGFGLMLTTAGLLAGGRVVLAERFSPGAVLDAVGSEGATVLHGSAAHFRLLLDRLDPARHDVSTLRIGVASASAFPVPLLRSIMDGLGMRLMLMYGSSEGVGVATTDRGEMLLGSVGRPERGSVAIMDEEGRPLPAGEVGEIAFSREFFPVRYWNPDADGRVETVASGWYHSGDLGRLDAEGRLFVVGRVKHQINRGGTKVDPAEVEHALLGCPGVAEAAVIGVPDPVLGETVCACVVPGPGSAPSLEGLREALGGVLAPFKLPQALHLFPELPRTVLGKVDVERLRGEVAGAAGRPRQGAAPCA